MHDGLMKNVLLSCWVLGSLGACAGGSAAVGAEHLPVKRIVMYRNGVAYFERAGQVVGTDLEFDVRSPNVGDFLSSLTAVEAGGAGAVRSVSFVSPELEVSGAGEAPDKGADQDRVAVKLNFDHAGVHYVAVAYVVESPIWRPAYRVVIDDSGLLLQAWAVVQNTWGVVERDSRLDEQQGRSLRIDRGQVVVERFKVRASRYRVRNGRASEVQVFLRHPRWDGTELVEPPVGTELT